MRGRRRYAIRGAERIATMATALVERHGSTRLLPDHGGRTTLGRRPATSRILLRHAPVMPWGGSWELDIPVGHRRSGAASLDDGEMASCLRDAADALLSSVRTDRGPDHQQTIAKQAASHCAHLAPDTLIMTAAFGGRWAKGRLGSGRPLPQAAREIVASCGQAMSISISARRRGTRPKGFNTAMRIDQIEGGASIPSRQ